MLKSRDIILLSKVHLVKAMVFPVVMYGCESWTVKKAEHQRVLEKTLESPLDCKKIQLVHPKGDHGIRSHHFTANRWGNSGNSERLYFLWAPKSLRMVIAAMKLKDACSLGKNL